MPTDLPFNLNATPRTGQGPFGLVPGAIGLPPVYNDVAGVFPNLSGNLGALSQNISSDLAGELDPQTIAMLQNTAAQFGIGQGTPLSPFSGAQGLRQLGLTAEAQRRQGAQTLLSALPTVAKSLTVSPETQLEVADRNATLGAAPDPEKAAREAQRLFDLYMAKLMGSRGGGVTYSGGGGGGGAPRNTNTSDFFNTPWAAFQPAAVGGTRPYVAPSGGATPWGNTFATPHDLSPQGPELGLWGEQGPLLGGAGDIETNYWNDWFGDLNDPIVTPDQSYLDEWGSGG